MLFNSIPFLCFFYPLTLAGYYFISSYRRQMVAVMWLIACSIFFYSWWNVRYAALLIATMVFNYYLGTSLSRGTRYAKTILVFGIGVDIALLAYFKYMNFFISSVNSLLSTNWATLNIILPLGISFYTFQQIAYRVEAYEGKRKGDTFLNYCCCVTFFPHLIAGPIVRYASLMPQFSNPNTFKFQPRNMSIGLTLLTLGLVKKLLIADPCGARANPLFLLAASGEPISLWEAWVGILSFTFQIYFDFSGYCDMATGLARTFNIDLPVNFNSPYKARSIVEFWSRSHISLSNFFRDHLYQPLARAKARGGRSWLYFCVFSTMLISGI